MPGAILISSSFVAAVGGAFLLLAWWSQREATSMLLWGLGNLAFAAGYPLLLEGAGAALPPTVVGGALFVLGGGLIWSASRVSNDRSVDPLFIAAGPVLWLAAFAIPEFRALPGVQAALNQALVAVYMFVAAAEFFDRSRRLTTSRQPLVVLVTLHGLFFAYGAFETALARAVDPLGFWLGIVHYETLVFVIGTSMFAVAVSRERREIARIAHANTDDLTGLANRRAFYGDASVFFRDAPPADGALSIILFDLDGFKRINDQLGHATGDNVLATFGRTARAALRGHDIMGRIGGDEFVALVRGAGPADARELAERIRTSFAETCSMPADRNIAPTVSVGIAGADGIAGLDALIGRADVALYKAKTAGRNRISIFESQPEVGHANPSGRPRRSAA